ncbi:hypothetical protein PENTCL1PPCAC_20197 [Pristionchus entomophagus]|uniref:UBC core domain-containing protein n=1 Tax=Pristionchus entomophagus TaxID=358040 RepID=A0AAV5TU94_9BILA|nr:hypothetical protein PENTCL1PPCAC_20197 [Pristionchus entomophagus]
MDGASVAIAYAKNVHKQRVEREIRTLPITLSPVVESIDKHIIEQNFTIKCRCMNASLEGVPFVIVADLSVDYPFKPPKIKFEGKIVHPNVDKVDGEVCIPILSYDNWKATCTLENVIMSVMVHLVEPDTNRPISLDAAEFFLKNRTGFFAQLKESLMKI